MNTLEMIVNITGSFFFYYIASTEQPLIRYEPIQLEVLIQYSKRIVQIFELNSTGCHKSIENLSN